SYYQSQGHNDPLVISIPKGGYAPAWEWRSSGPPAETSTRLQSRWVWIVGSVALMIFGASVVTLASRRTPRPARVIFPITSYPGIQNHPQLSPDGSRIAFLWDGGKQEHLSVYVKEIAGGEPRRLTKSPW